MNRRDSLKALGLTTVSAELLLNACRSAPKKTEAVDARKLRDSGLQQSEIALFDKLYAEPPYFNDHEMRTITVLSDMIIPKDEVSGSASDAEVPAFIAFIVKALPEHQLPLRGGLKWLDVRCLNSYGQAFVDCTEADKLDIVNKIAYPEKATPEMRPGVAFFNLMRNLTASGFYTSKMGIEDVGFIGNQPNEGTGVPEEVLIEHGMLDLYHSMYS